MLFCEQLIIKPIMKWQGQNPTKKLIAKADKLEAVTYPIWRKNNYFPFQGEKATASMPKIFLKNYNLYQQST